MIDTSPSVSLRHIENLIYGKDNGNCEDGLLVTQERMTDADGSKVTAKI